jgi:glutathione peroxidase
MEAVQCAARRALRASRFGKGGCAARRTAGLCAAVLAAVVWIGLTPAAGLAMSAHDFEFSSIDGKPLPFSAFKGKTVLLVNTASQCGFTPQYAGLQELWRRYRDRGLVVLGVPSNDFGRQEPGGAADIKKFCEVNFAVDFPLTDKQRVIGPEAHPLYRWLAKELGEDAAPRWNFHKYLIGPDGQVAELFPSRVDPLAPEVVRAVEATLKR